MKRRDLILLAGILAAAAILYLIYQAGFGASESARLQITVAGEIYGNYDLGEDREIPINDTNVCRIEDGVVRMTESSCPDHLCEHQKAIDNRGGNIVCLPNRVVLEIVDGAEDGIDGIAF